MKKVKPIKHTPGDLNGDVNQEREVKTEDVAEVTAFISRSKEEKLIFFLTGS